jgi:hypothetical protein
MVDQYIETAIRTRKQFSRKPPGCGELKGDLVKWWKIRSHVDIPLLWEDPCIEILGESVRLQKRTE